jgi:hypothetical protein
MWRYPSLLVVRNAHFLCRFLTISTFVLNIVSYLNSGGEAALWFDEII